MPKPLIFLSLFVKRSFDIFAAALGLILLSPFFLYVILLIKRDSPGPIFFRGRRAGLHGKVFHILKFRTMREDPASYAGPKITARDDPRITPLGAWLRKTKLNELPQLWNVLIGDMSLVGPRPEDPDIAANWPENIRREILSVRPGITSPASVQFRNEEELLRHASAMDSYMADIVPTKLRLDQLYVRNRSFWLDLDTIFWTIILLIPRLRRYDPGEALLFWGPLNRMARRHMSWFILDLAISFFAMAISGLFWRSLFVFNIGITRAVYLTIGFAVLLSLINLALGVNRISWEHAKASDIFSLIPATVLATFIIGALNREILPNNLWLDNTHIMPTRVIASAGVIAYGGFISLRYRTRLLSGLASRWVGLRRTGLSQALERVLIVGGGDSGQFTAWMLERQRRTLPMHIIGFVDDNPYQQGVLLHGLPVLGGRLDIPAIVKKHDIGIILFAIHNISEEERGEMLRICAATGARIVVMPDLLHAFQEALLAAPQVEHTAVERWITLPANALEIPLVEIETALSADDPNQARLALAHLRGLLRKQIGSRLTTPTPRIHHKIPVSAPASGQTEGQLST
jgi:lipopolysaccharide/colanic/teichoic acid biosynthesis glycosyltransferase